jgi:MarR family transcriptional regulator, organic hydroperoxide resistance regulator
MKGVSSRQSTKPVVELILEIRKFIAGVILFNEKVAAQAGLNGTDLQCLHLLGLQGGATPSELAKCASITSGGMTVVLDRLERAGYIRRERNPEDRRSLIVRPVAAQMRRLERIYRSKSRAVARILSEYDERQLKLLLEFFEKANRSRYLE